jgi:hypothetical protein
LLQGRGISGRPRRKATEARRAFRHEFAGDLWMGDVLHGPRVIMPGGFVRKSYLHLFLDSATRLVPGCAFRQSETATDHEAVLKQALMKHGLPRVLYLDQGAAQTARSLKVICAELGIRLLHCRPYDPAAKGAVERILRTVREEVLDEVAEKLLLIEELNSLLWSWVSAEYHKRVHSSTEKAPLEHWLSQADKLRAAPPGHELDRIFMHREWRKVRKDSTVRFKGRMLEVRPELCSTKVELRWFPDDQGATPQVFVDGKFYCDTVELDVVRNSCRSRGKSRQQLDTAQSAPKPKTGLEPLELIRDEHTRTTQSPRAEKPSTKE